MANGCIGAAVDLLSESKRGPMLENRHAVSEICRLLAARTRPDELLALLLSFGTKRAEVTVAEVKALAGGDGSGRVQR